MIKEELGTNGHESYPLNHEVTDQPELVTEEKLAIMDYLFKEIDLNSDEDFRELGREFDE